MNTSKSVEVIYAVVEKKLGDNQAREAVLSALGNILYDLKEEKIEISEENISYRLEKYAQDYLEASKSDVA